MHGFLRGHFERLRRDPGEDLVSRLVDPPEEEALTERELHATVMLLLGAGFETTVNLLGNAVVLLDAHRDQWDALRADPAGWPKPSRSSSGWTAPCSSPAGRRAPTSRWPAARSGRARA